MKNNIFKSLILFIAVTTFSSCLKDDSLVLDPEKGHNVIEFANPTDIVVHGSVLPLYAFSYELVPEVSLPLTVSYSGPEAAAPQDITVNLAIGGQAPVDVYNEDQHTEYELMPAGSYELTTTSVVIPKGQSKATFTVKFKPQTFDLEALYAVPVTISSASSGIVSGNFGTIILGVGAKNQYDGVYSYDGSTFRNSATGPDAALSGNFTNLTARPLVTKTANSVYVAPLWANGSGIGGIDQTYATVDPVTNLVTVASLTNATVRNTPGKVNKYDPATKTFTLAFEWGAAPNDRVVTMVLKRTGARQ